MQQRVPACLCFVLAVSCSASANIIINNPAAANHIPAALGADGDSSVLRPDPVRYLAAGGPEAAELFAVLTLDFPAATGWTFMQGGALSGTLNVDQYIARVPAEHRLGAGFEARYTRAATDPPVENLRWIQLVNTTRDGPRAFVDPLPNDPEPGNPPFFYTEDQNFNRSSNRLPSPFGNYDLLFSDFPAQDCRDHPDFWTLRFATFLVTYTPTPGGVPGMVTIHDGVEWGYDATCVPETRTAVYVVIALLVIALARFPVNIFPRGH
jgi:hypothetical protein